MLIKQDNYQIQAAQAKKKFLTYDQQELIRRCHLSFDDRYLYTRFLSERLRICRESGDMQRLNRGKWVDANSFGEVMTVLDWLCDSKSDRYITGRWINVVTHGHYFHGDLQEDSFHKEAAMIDRQPEVFARACRALGGEPMPGADIGYAIELVDGLGVLVQFWHADEEFAPRIRILWDENTSRYLRYETTWYASALVMSRLQEKMTSTEDV